MLHRKEGPPEGAEETNAFIFGIPQKLPNAHNFGHGFFINLNRFAKGLALAGKIVKFRRHCMAFFAGNGRKWVEACDAQECAPD